MVVAVLAVVVVAFAVAVRHSTLAVEEVSNVESVECRQSSTSEVAAEDFAGDVVVVHARPLEVVAD